MKKFFLGLALLIGMLGSFALPGCGSMGAVSGGNPIAAHLGESTTQSTTVVFRILATPGAVAGGFRSDALLAQIATPTVEFSLQMVNTGNPTNPTTTLKKTVTAIASGTGFAAVATFADIPLQSVVGKIQIVGGSLGGASILRGAGDLVAGPLNVIDLAASGGLSLPDLKAQVLETLVVTPTDFERCSGLLVTKIETAFTAASIRDGSTYSAAYSAFLASLPPNRFSVSGFVTAPGGVSGSDGTTLTLTSNANSNIVFTTTTTAGSYSITGVPDGTYTLVPTRTGDSFTPSSIDVTVAGGNLSNLNFQASLPVVSVFISGFAFSPVTTTISVGQTVEWTNKDSANHTVTSDTSLFDSGTMGLNSTYSRTFSSVGTFKYHCGIHPSMTATIVVQ